MARRWRATGEVGEEDEEKKNKKKKKKKKKKITLRESTLLKKLSFWKQHAQHRTKQ